MHNNQYTTLTEATEKLIKRGYTHNLSINDEGFLIGNNDLRVSPSDVELHEFHRFEGMTNPDDMSIIYAVKTDSGLKGTVVDSYGADGSMVTSEFMNKVKQRQYDS